MKQRNGSCSSGSQTCNLLSSNTTNKTQTRQTKQSTLKQKCKRLKLVNQKKARKEHACQTSPLRIGNNITCKNRVESQVSLYCVKEKHGRL